MKLRRNIVIALAAVVVAAILAVPFVLEMRAAALLLEDLAAGDAPSTLKSATQSPARSRVAWTIDGRANWGDLYVPAEGARGRLVLVPGLAAFGREHPRFIAFAMSLARSGFAVLAPAGLAMSDLKASTGDVTVIADAAAYFAGATLPGKPSEGTGIAAISFAAGPAILAAAEPSVRDKVKFVLAIGGYYDMREVVAFVTTRRYRTSADAPWIEGKPAAYATWAFVAANAANLDDANDRDLLMRMARAKFADGAADVSALAAGLGVQGQSVYALLTNSDPERVPALIEALPARLKDTLGRLDLARADLSQVKARLVLIHGRDDPMIPATQSARLAAAAADSSLTVVEQVGHVELSDGGSIVDGLRLLCATRAVISQLD